MLTSTKYLAFLKASATWDAEPTHLTLVKQRPLCARAAYRPMSAHGGAAPERLAPSTGSGPYCCEGHGCPSEDEYEPAELACEMPALSPRGVPRCSNLQGAPLPNLALASAGASAAISSAYPFAENAGAGAAIDGRLDGRWGGSGWGGRGRACPNGAAVGGGPASYFWWERQRGESEQAFLVGAAAQGG